MITEEEIPSEGETEAIMDGTDESIPNHYRLQSVIEIEPDSHHISKLEASKNMLYSSGKIDLGFSETPSTEPKHVRNRFHTFQKPYSYLPHSTDLQDKFLKNKDKISLPVAEEEEKKEGRLLRTFRS